jgi:hypothetical protein
VQFSVCVLLTKVTTGIVVLRVSICSAIVCGDDTLELVATDTSVEYLSGII